MRVRRFARYKFLRLAKQLHFVLKDCGIIYFVIMFLIHV